MVENLPGFVGAEVALKARLYHDAVRYLTDFCKQYPRVTREQSVLLSKAFHHAVAHPREAIRVLHAEAAAQIKQKHAALAEQFRSLAKPHETELSKYCHSLLELIDVSLLPVAGETTLIVFYTKLKGDYYRYLAEIPGSDRGNVSRAKNCYEQAMRSVGDDVKISDPIYLSLALNYSVFQWDFLNAKDEAIERAEGSFTEALRYMDELDEKEYQESAMLLQLLKDNVALWKEERGDDQELRIDK
jgi:hypothetical protein